MTLRDRYLAILRIPPAPEPPADDRDVRVFRASQNYFYYRVLIWLVRQAGAAVGVFIGIGVAVNMVPAVVPAYVPVGPFGVPRWVFLSLAIIGEAIAVGGFFAQLIASGLLLRLDFEQRWYMVSDRSLRIREGLIKLQEKTMTFANIQHVTIRQGPLQRWLGIADLEVRTAGGGTPNPQQHGKADTHVGYFRGLDDAMTVRDTIRDRMKRYADTGLGDPDDAPEPWTRGSQASAWAAGAVLLRDEARALRLGYERDQ